MLDAAIRLLDGPPEGGHAYVRLKPDTTTVLPLVEKSTPAERAKRVKVGGGGGSRTRVRKYVPAGLYMRVRFWVLVPGVRKRRKTARHQAR